MIVSDPFMVQTLHHPKHFNTYSVQAMLAVGVVVTAKLWIKYRASQELVVEPVMKGPFLLDDWDLR